MGRSVFLFFKLYKDHATSRFIDGLCAVNDDEKLPKSFKLIYARELKQEHSGTDAKFSDQYIKIEDGLFDYKLFDKRDKF